MLRKVAVWKTIKDLNPNDEKVKIIGRVVFFEDDLLILDDGTGTIKVIINELINNLENEIFLVTGFIHQKNDGEIVLEAESITGFENFNFKLYLQVYNIIKRYKEKFS
ncbi:MAG: hypothetical protein ACTSYQ_03070 [Candidatus Odinarchaeia archaeon]